MAKRIVIKPRRFLRPIRRSIGIARSLGGGVANLRMTSSRRVLKCSLRNGAGNLWLKCDGRILRRCLSPCGGCRGGFCQRINNRSFRCNDRGSQSLRCCNRCLHQLKLGPVIKESSLDDSAVMSITLPFEGSFMIYVPRSWRSRCLRLRPRSNS